MSTAAVSGKTGRIEIGTTVAEVVDWNADIVTEALDATSMSSGGKKEFIAGLEEGSGSFATVQFLNKRGAQAAATFGVGASAASNAPDISGKIIITTEGTAVPVDGRVAYSYDFVFNATATIAVS